MTEPTPAHHPRLPRRSDVVLAATVVIATVAAARAYTLFNDEGRALTLTGVVLIVALGSSLLLRQWPVIALAVGLGALIPYQLQAYPSEVVLPTVLILLYTLALQGNLIYSLSGGLAAALAMFIPMGHSANGWPGGDAIDSIGWLLAAIAFGHAIQSQRAYAHEAEQRARRAEHTRETEAARRVAEERLRIARDLHDVMAHTMAVIRMQSSVAAYLIDEREDTDPELATLAVSLHHIADAGHSAMSELRVMLDVLRGSGTDAGERAVVPGLSQIDDVVSSARVAGVEVDVDEIGEPRPLPIPVDVAAYRIIQESLTNVGKHAQGSPARVTLDYQPVHLRIRIADKGGQPPAGDFAFGYGLTGMAERAHAVGGTLAAGAGSDGVGFTVEAVLPCAETPVTSHATEGATQ